MKNVMAIIQLSHLSSWTDDTRRRSSRPDPVSRVLKGGEPFTGITGILLKVTWNESKCECTANVMFPQVAERLPQQTLPEGQAELLHHPAPGPRGRRDGAERPRSARFGGGTPRSIASFREPGGGEEGGGVEQRTTLPVVKHGLRGVFQDAV